MGFLKRLFNKRVRNRRKKNGDQDFGCGENPFGLIFSIVELVFLDQKVNKVVPQVKRVRDSSNIGK